ncbi:serine protease [Parasalinivibrio latis]|uniref:trypsin-like serine peptidase n=1 Tax=Parasalinivibrio latis TaxID=2952610 RepID=UPI0030E47950
MPMSANKHLEDCDCCELRDELHKRETETLTGQRTAKNSRALGAFDTKALLKKLIEKERAEYGVGDRKLVYGNDDREDIFQVTDAQIQNQSRAVMALIDASKIRDNGDSTSTIRTMQFSQAQMLCPSEPFGEQPTAPHCTGFLVAPDIIATAGHCINNNDLARTRFFFGFQMIDHNTPKVIIPSDDIYRGIEIIDRKLENTDSDYALVRLDRPVTNRPILTVRRSGKIPDDSNVYVIGHPSGLPMKFADGAFVRDNSHSIFFTANLDTYGGNSGSPVFNQATGEVEGILVRGDTDFVFNGSCRVSNVCPINGCRGEDVTRASEFVTGIPQVPPVTPPASSNLADRISEIEDKLDQIGDDLADIKSQL